MTRQTPEAGEPIKGPGFGQGERVTMMGFLRGSVSAAFVLVSSMACAHGTGVVLEGRSGQPASLANVVHSIAPGSIVLVGENHGVERHQRQQMALMYALRQAGHVVSVGMEFLSYPQQGALDRYRSGVLSEADFLAEVSWGGFPFALYREQILFPEDQEGGVTWALNAPRSLTSRIARVGLSGLTPEETALLPPGFALGRDSYRRRFSEQMPHLPDPSALDRYFAAQCTWDDTMAWRISEWRASHPGQTLVVVVGEFHTRYGGGLGDRVFARLGERPVLISQVQLAALSPEDQAAELAGDPEDGPRADWIWTDLAP